MTYIRLAINAEIAYKAAEEMGGISTASYFIYDPKGKSKIHEVSYFYISKAPTNTEGYWDRNLDYYDKAISPEEEIIKTVTDCS
jgi:hypothetical protein